MLIYWNENLFTSTKKNRKKYEKQQHTTITELQALDLEQAHKECDELKHVCWHQTLP